MNLKSLFARFSLDKVKLNFRAVELEFSFQAADKDAAWDLYVEMLTRISTQPLAAEAGNEKVALESVYSLFPTTREILKHHGRSSIQFSRIAVPVLNQVIRPFATKWHNQSLNGAFDQASKRAEFRSDLASLQVDLRNYNRMLAEIAGVEDLAAVDN